MRNESISTEWIPVTWFALENIQMKWIFIRRTLRVHLNQMILIGHWNILNVIGNEIETRLARFVLFIEIECSMELMRHQRRKSKKEKIEIENKVCWKVWCNLLVVAFIVRYMLPIKWTVDLKIIGFPFPKKDEIRIY